MSLPKTSSAHAPLHSIQRRYMLAMLTMIYAVNFIDRTIINVLVQPIKTDLQLSDTQIGLVSGAAFGILYALMGLPLARVADRHSRVTLVSVAMGFWSLMTAACGLAHNFWHLFAARVGVGVGEAGCTPAAQSMISDAYPADRRSSALSIYSLGVPIGTLFGALFGGWVGQAFGWRMAFLVVGLPGIAVAVVARLTLREPPRGLLDQAATQEAAPRLSEAMTAMWRHPAFPFLAGGFTFGAIAGNGITLFLVAYLQRRLGISLIDASFAFGIGSGLTGIAGMLLGGIATDRAIRRDRRMQCWVPAIALAITGPLLIAGLMQRDAVSMGLFLIPAAIFYPMYIGPGFAAAHSFVEPRIRATATATLLLISTLLGTTLGPVLTGAISDVASRARFGDGFDRLCGVAAQGSACVDATAHGLMIALVCAAALYAGASLCFALAGRRMERGESRPR